MPQLEGHGLARQTTAHGVCLLLTGLCGALGFLRGGVGRCGVVTATGSGNVDFGKPLGEVFLDGGVVGVGRKIFPFVRVGFFVVELFVAVGVADIAIGFAPHAVVLIAVGRESGSV